MSDCFIDSPRMSSQDAVKLKHGDRILVLTSVNNVRPAYVDRIIRNKGTPRIKVVLWEDRVTKVCPKMIVPVTHEIARRLP